MKHDKIFKYVNIEGKKVWNVILFADTVYWIIFSLYIFKNIYLIVLVNLINVAFLILTIQYKKIKELIIIRIIIDNIFQILFSYVYSDSLSKEYFFVIVVATIINVVVCQSKLLKVYLYVVAISPIFKVIIHDNKVENAFLLTSILIVYVCMYLVNKVLNIPKKISDELILIRSVYDNSLEVVSKILIDLITMHLDMHKTNNSDQIITYMKNDVININNYLSVVLKYFPDHNLETKNEVSFHQINVFDFTLPLTFLLNATKSSQLSSCDTGLKVVLNKNIDENIISEIVWAFSRIKCKAYISNNIITLNFKETV